MSTPLRRIALAAMVAATTLLAACGSDVASPASGAPASVDPAVAESQRVAYNEAICPLFTAIVDLDPRLAALRAAGTSGDLSEIETELGATTAAMLSVLNALEAVPEWAPGTELRFHLTSSLHVIRTQLVIVADALDDPESAELLAELPFIASDAMDRAMQRAVEGGLDCEGIE